jgi:hypothetical protein
MEKLESFTDESGERNVKIIINNFQILIINSKLFFKQFIDSL